MCTANYDGFYGTPSAQILMCTATKIYVYIRILIYSTVTPVTLTFNLPEKIFQMALLLLEGNNCAKLF